MINKCVSCGDVIPEGRQVCPSCEKKPIDNDVIELTLTIHKVIPIGLELAEVLAKELIKDGYHKHSEEEQYDTCK